MQTRPQNTTPHGSQSVSTLDIKYKRLQSFFDIHKKIGTVRNIDQLIPLVMMEISKFLDAERSTLFLIDWESMELWTKFAEGLEVERIAIALKMGLIGSCVLSKAVLNIADASEDPRFNATVDQTTGFRTESVLAAPFFNPTGAVTGALQLINKKTGVFSKEDEAIILKQAKRLTDNQFDPHKDVEFAKRVIDELKASTACKRASFFVIDMVRGELNSLQAEGLDGEEIHLSINLGIAGVVAITGQALNILDAYPDPRFDRSTDEKTGYKTRCILCVPVISNSGETLGVIQAINKKEGVFEDADLELLKTLSYGISVSLENAILFQDQQRQFRSVLKVMAASIDAKDHLTAGHSEGVERYAAGIAKELGFGEKEIDVLSVAALLHDYGKLGIDDNILKKPGRLTGQEIDHIKQHVVLTRKILDQMYFARKYRNVPLIASSHHERLDGSGYMNGLKGNDIPFMSKILAVADVFEALTAKRHYRDALAPEQALEIIEEDAKTQFDENIIHALKRYWTKQKSDRGKNG